MDRLKKLYIDTFGHPPNTINQLKGDGSDRQIYRIVKNNNSIIGILGNNIPENHAFISFSRQMKSIGLAVPDIIAVNDDETVYLETDFGDITLYDFIKQENGFTENTINVYKLVLTELPKFQINLHLNLDYSVCYQQDVFGIETITNDFNYFKQRFLFPFYKEKVDFEFIDSEFQALLKVLVEAPNEYFLYRDFQSRNIMFVSNTPHFIDYQSGRRGALQYDLASLLYDAKARVPEPVRKILIEHYQDELEKYISIDRDEFMYYFYPFVWIRIMQALGAYGFLSQHKGKTSFLQNIPLALDNIQLLLTQNTIMDNFESLKTVFINLVNDNSLHRLEKIK